MRAKLLLPFCVPLACCGLWPSSNIIEEHALQPQCPQGSLKPLGRHIQYCHNGRAGIRDRMTVFNWFMDLAAFNNATVHIAGGSSRADLHLNAEHSHTVSRDWSHYLQIPEESCRGPFSELQPFDECPIVTDKDFDFSQPLFGGENGCVRLMPKWYYRGLAATNPFKSTQRCHTRVSGDIRERARQVLKEQGLPERFGAVHLRRCDKIQPRFHQVQCTAPDIVASVIRNITDIDAWFIFYYAEEGYRDRLKGLLECPSCNRTVIFEDSVRLNPIQDGDNYYTFLVGQTILEMATTRVLARNCVDGNPWVEGSGQERELSLRLGGLGSVDLESESELFGLCRGPPEKSAATA